MKLSSLIVLRPVCFFVLLAVVVLLLPCLVIPYWYKMITRIEHNVELNSYTAHSELLSEIENSAKVLYPINSSATNLARTLSSSLNGTKLSFSQIETMVVPKLFQALSIIPYLSQISYIGLDGLFFSYYFDGNQIVAVYSNSSFPVSAWYTQPVNRDTGKLYGNAINSDPLITVNASWFREALNSPNGYASMGFGWKNAHNLLFLNTAGFNGIGALSLGFPVKEFTNFFSSINLHGGSLFLSTKDGKTLIEGLPNAQMVVLANSVSFILTKPTDNQMGPVGNISCVPSDGTLKVSFLNIQNTEYMFYCSPLEIVGVQSVYALAFPFKDSTSLVHRDINLALVLLISMIVVMVISIFTFVFLIARAARREMYLCATLIKQMEATQQAERKSMNKSLAFASASHDVRAALAAIIGLVEICHEEVAPGSELESNIIQIEGCTKDLFGILNSILDTSKIEAGKMLLEEEEFNVAELLEDVVDLYHPVGTKKGVDVVLDHYDGSINKFSRVKGDRGKLRQILCNLLSNAVKFTSEGHVSVRAWAKKPTFENSILASNRNNSLKFWSCLFFKNSIAYKDLGALNTPQQNANFMEFVFEVDDTGRGIPKEMQKTVFENFVQVKETAPGQGGTGLGLGIVQSLVRLMGGEIGIVDKGIGEKGTCFRFNVFLTMCEAVSINDVREDIVGRCGDCRPGDLHQHLGASVCGPSPKLEGSHVVLLIRSEERQRVAKKFMESLGIKVLVVRQWENFRYALKRIASKTNHSSHPSSSGRSDSSPLSDRLNKSDHILPVHRKTNPRSTNCILLLIDITAGPLPELWRAVSEFRKDLCTGCCKVVWLDKPILRNNYFRGFEDDNLAPTDRVISKPFHGSRLYQVIKLLPEFGGLQGISVRPKREHTLQIAYQNSVRSKSGNSLVLRQQLQQGDIQEHGGLNNEKPLAGKKILVAEDGAVLRKLAMSNLTRLGAAVELCENGQEAVELVCKGLSDLRKHGASSAIPYDYVLMDCEMPVMDGYEATREIRKEEKYYGIHIPIIALTAHTAYQGANKTLQAGMDAHLAKPLKREALLEAIQSIHRK